MSKTSVNPRSWIANKCCGLSGPLTRKIIAVILLPTFASAQANTDLLGSVAAESYGSTTYEEIEEIELRSYSSLLQHPYEVFIPNTPFRNLIHCNLHDAQGEVVAWKGVNTGNGETWIFFTEKVPDASARCYYVRGERRIRPSTGPIPRTR